MLAAKPISQSNTACKTWLVFVIATLGIPYQFYLQSATAVMIHGLHRSYGLDSRQLGFLTSAFFYTYLFFQIPAGLIVDQIGPRKALCIGFVACGLSCLGFAFAPTYGVAIVCRLLMGASSAFFVPAAMVAALRSFPVARFAMCAGLAESIGMAGGALGEVGIARAVSLSGWRHAMLFSALLGLGLGLTSFFALRSLPAKTAAHMSNFRDTLRDTARSLRQVLSYRVLWMLALFAGLTFALLATFAGLWAIPFFHERYHLLNEQSVALSSLIFWGVAIFAPLVGAFYSRTHLKKRLLQFLVSGAFLLFLAVLFVPLGMYLSSLVLFLLGAFSSVYVLAFAMIPNVLPEQLRGAGSGLVNMGAMLLGAILLQPLIGWWLDKTPSFGSARLWHYQEGLAVLPILLVAAFFLSRMLPVREAVSE